MSKYNNVNPGQYKVAGRERPDDLARERMKNMQAKPVSKSSRKRTRQERKKG